MTMRRIFAVLLFVCLAAAPSVLRAQAVSPAGVSQHPASSPLPAQPCGNAVEFLQRLDRREPVAKRIYESGMRWRAFLAAEAQAALLRMAEVNPDWRKTAHALCDGRLGQVRADVTPMAERNVADALFVLGCAAFLQRDFPAAAQAFSDAAALDRQNPDYLGALGQTHVLARDMRSAAPLLAAAWKAEERMRGRTALAAWLAENVADAHRSLGDSAFSAQVAAEAAALYAGALGPDAVQVGMARARMGGALLDAGRADEAEAALRAALDLFMRDSGPDTPLVAETLRSLGNIRVMRGEREAAGELYGAALVSAANWYGLEAPELGPYLAPLGILRYHLGQYDEAIELLRDARNAGIALYGSGAAEVQEMEGWIRLCEEARVRGALPGGAGGEAPRD